MQRLAVIAVASLVCSGCCAYWHDHPVVVSSTGQKLCSRHRIPLITVRGYGTRDYGSQRYLTLSHSWGLQARKEECNPNHVPLDQSLHRSKEYPTPISVTYCPKCEDGSWLTPEEDRRVQEELKRDGVLVEHVQ